MLLHPHPARVLRRSPTSPLQGEVGGRGGRTDQPVRYDSRSETRKLVFNNEAPASSRLREPQRNRLVLALGLLFLGALGRLRRAARERRAIE